MKYIKNNKAITLIELVLTITIFSLYFVSLLTFISYFITLSKESDEKMEANNLAIDLIEKERLSDNKENFSTTIDEFKVDVNIKKIPRENINLSNLYQIVVKIKKDNILVYEIKSVKIIN
ncbi:MAG: type II secretion system protein [Firmicutes bacterium]|nr:type II secretion system protein [Bacillota bacterium]